MEKINIGSKANDGTGDSLRVAAGKINAVIDFVGERSFLPRAYTLEEAEALEPGEITVSEIVFITDGRKPGEDDGEGSGVHAYAFNGRLYRLDYAPVEV